VIGFDFVHWDFVTQRLTLYSDFNLIWQGLLCRGFDLACIAYRFWFSSLGFSEMLGGGGVGVKCQHACWNWLARSDLSGLVIVLCTNVAHLNILKAESHAEPVVLIQCRDGPKVVLFYCLISDCVVCPSVWRIGCSWRRKIWIEDGKGFNEKNSEIFFLTSIINNHSGERKKFGSGWDWLYIFGSGWDLWLYIFGSGWDLWLYIFDVRGLEFWLFFMSADWELLSHSETTLLLVNGCQI
jgi:hypothetical protein